MFTSTPAPVPRPLAQPFPPAERAAALWACACALMLLQRADNDAEADALRSLLPTLPAAVEALKADSVRPEHFPAISAALVAVLEMRRTLAPATWAALNPPPVPDLEAARARALSLDAGPELRAVQA